MKITKLTYEKGSDGFVCVGPFCEPGQKLYYSAWNDIVIPVTIWEVVDFYEGFSVIRPMIGPSYASRPTEETDNGGWPIHECIEDYKDLIADKPIRNQFLWIDEPIGHSLTLGDDIFLTLEEALSQIRPTNKKHLKQRLLYFRKRMSGFIRMTWKMNGESGPTFPKWEKKRVYIRKG
jgi:hypothetical protein